jgi:predicted nucleic acid-binding protein
VSTCFDASALAKLLIDEGDSDIAGDLWAAAESAFASVVGYAEIRGSISRALRGGRITPDGYPTARLALERVWGSVVEIRLDGALPRLAGSLADRHGLRALDAIQLASALSIATPEDRPTLVTFDRRLAEAALAEGLTVLPEGA